MTREEIAELEDLLRKIADTLAERDRQLDAMQAQISRMETYR